MDTTSTPGGPRGADGEVVLLFTDIEDSTPKWETWPEAMAEALERHDAIVQGTVAAQQGTLVKHTGDGFLARFPGAVAAIAAALEAQRRLREADFSDVGGLAVRAAIHRGPAQERDGDLFGTTLNQCGRVMSAAHGGQVLVTAAVARALGDEGASWCEENGVRLLDLGEHRFKGLGSPERVFQVTCPDLDQLFPALRSLNARLGNLPATGVDLVGRAGLVERVVSHLAESAVVTLTGPSGVGKTSVALGVGKALVDEFPDGVWIVDLSRVGDAGGVALAIAQTMGVAARQGQTLDETLHDVLGARRALLVLDSAERPRAGTRTAIARLVTHGSATRVLATSLSPLGVPGEVRVRVEPFATPPDLEVTTPAAALRWPAIELLVERARAASPDFRLDEGNVAAAVTICERLDGLPLAIVLAAARAELLTLDQIAARLERRFQLLGGPAAGDHRHETLRATLAWSVELLGPDAAATFNELGALVSPFDLETARAVTGRDELDVVTSLAELVNDSLVVAERDERGPRYRMLESIRLFAEERLAERAEVLDVRRRHAEHFADLAAELRRVMWGEHALDLIEATAASLADERRAFEHLLEVAPDRALTMVGDLYGLWVMRDLPGEGLRWLDDVLNRYGGLEAVPPSPGLVSVLDDVGDLTWMVADFALAERYLNAATAAADALGIDVPPKALVRLGSIRMLSGHLEDGVALCHRALELAAWAEDDTRMVVERMLGAVLSLAGERERGAEICRQAVERARRSDLWLASALVNLVWSTYSLDPAAAVESAHEAIAEASRLGSAFYLGSAWSGLATAYGELGFAEASCRAWAESLDYTLATGAKNHAFESLRRMSETLFDVVPEVAVRIAAGASRQPGPGADGTWRDARHEALAGRAEGVLSPEAFEGAWREGEALSIDHLVDLAREWVDAIFPPELVAAGRAGGGGSPLSATTDKDS